MKIIKIEGCMGCSFVNKSKSPMFGSGAFYLKLIQELSIAWEVNPYYIHPDCPLEDEIDIAIRVSKEMPKIFQTFQERKLRLRILGGNQENDNY